MWQCPERLFWLTLISSHGNQLQWNQHIKHGNKTISYLLQCRLSVNVFSRYQGGIYQEDSVDLYYGKCIIQQFWRLTHSRDRKQGYHGLCYFNFHHSFFNLSLMSFTDLWKCNTKSLAYSFNTTLHAAHQLMCSLICPILHLSGYSLSAGQATTATPTSQTDTEMICFDHAIYLWS